MVFVKAYVFPGKNDRPENFFGKKSEQSAIVTSLRDESLRHHASLIRIQGLTNPDYTRRKAKLAYQTHRTI